MPNNFTPHKHGNAQHHKALDKFKIKKVFSVKKIEIMLKEDIKLKLL